MFWMRQGYKDILVHDVHQKETTAMFSYVTKIENLGNVAAGKLDHRNISCIAQGPLHKRPKVLRWTSNAVSFAGRECRSGAPTHRFRPRAYCVCIRTIRNVCVFICVWKLSLMFACFCVGSIFIYTIFAMAATYSACSLQSSTAEVFLTCPRGSSETRKSVVTHANRQDT